jgi:hypothetical protein
MDFSNIKISCSDLPSLMSNGKENKPLEEKDREKLDKIKNKMLNGANLTKTDLKEYPKLIKREKAESEPFLISKSNENTLRIIYSREKYKKYPQSSSKDYSLQVVNGTMSEKASLELSREVLGKKIKVSKGLISNDHLKGIIDGYTGRTVYKANHIYEIKTAANYETFLNIANSDKEKSDYYWQVMGYLSITGAKKGTIIHSCVSYHPNIITQEINRYLAKIKGLNVPSEIVDKSISKIRNNMTFDDIPKSERIAEFTVERNDDEIELIRKKVLSFRIWLDDFQKKCLKMNK